MKIGVLGTGSAGQTLAGKFVEMGHDVMMGARSADNEKVVAFAQRTGGRAGTFADAAAFGELVFNCTRGGTSLETLAQLGTELAGKTLVDIARGADPARVARHLRRQIAQYRQRVGDDRPITSTRPTHGLRVRQRQARQRARERSAANAGMAVHNRSGRYHERACR
jgi:3-hydroxyisobutyrate dehydrogenase-like beta-hydroxyacid dehydrogenase